MKKQLCLLFEVRFFSKFSTGSTSVDQYLVGTFLQFQWYLKVLSKEIEAILVWFQSFSKRLIKGCVHLTFRFAVHAINPFVVLKQESSNVGD